MKLFQKTFICGPECDYLELGHCTPKRSTTSVRPGGFIWSPGAISSQYPYPLALSNKPNLYLPIWLLEATYSLSTHLIKTYLGNHKKISPIWTEVTPTTSSWGHQRNHPGKNAISPIQWFLHCGSPRHYSRAFWSLLAQIHGSKEDHPHLAFLATCRVP